MNEINKRIGELLLQLGVITNDQLNRALDVQRVHGGKLGAILVSLGYIAEDLLIALLGKKYGIPFISIAEYGEITSAVVDLIPAAIARHKTIMPLSLNGNELTVAVSDPLDVFDADELKLLTGYDIKIVVASESEINSFLDRYYSRKFLSPVANGVPENPADREANAEEFLDKIIKEAVKARASHIHIEPGTAMARIRYRIDGILHETQPIQTRMYGAIISQIKSSARLNMPDRQQLNEGVLKFVAGNHTTGIHVSLNDTFQGETAVLRIISQSDFKRDLSHLGFELESLATYKRSIAGLNGFIIVCGPFGSGKTTTLYSTLKHLNHPDRNIVTVESGIEAVIEGVNQIQVNNSTHAATHTENLERCLKQDPDVIMVDELRGKETTSLALNAALEGHLVLSSLNTNDAISSIMRMYATGVDPHLVASALTMIVVQRLVRTPCPDCKTVYTVAGRDMEAIGLKVEKANETGNISLVRANGCNNCAGTGYAGRTGCYEVFEISDELSRIMHEGATIGSLKSALNTNDRLTLKAAVLRKVLVGSTTVEEMMRIGVI